MKPKQRQDQIAEIVAREGDVSIETLVARLSVSAETVRRDLSHLAEGGVIRKVYGGARRPSLHIEGSFHDRLSAHAAAKRVIAQKLVPLISPGETIFVDTGSTTLICAEALATLGPFTVITNSARIASVFASGLPRHSIFLLGGAYSGDNAETLGPMVIEQIGAFQADHAIVSATAIDGDLGAMDADFNEARVARAMLDRARQLILVADASKFGQRAAHSVCGLATIDVLVSDQRPTPPLAAQLLAAGVALP